MSGVYRTSFDDTSNAAETEILGGTDQTKIGNVSDRLKVNSDVVSSVLPAGAATAANQTTANASLSSIDAGIPATLGQTTMANSMPVVLPSNQVISTSPTDSTKATYSASAVGFVCAAAATDIFTLQGSATKTIRVISLGVTGSTTAGSGASVSFSLIKRSAANTAGTSSTATNVPHDSSNVAATAVVKSYTANPSALGTSVGTIRTERIVVPTIGGQGSGYASGLYSYGNRPGQAIVLRGTSEFLCMNFAGVTITNPVICCDIEWTEE